MPESAVVITVKLWGNSDFWDSWDWEIPEAQGWVLADTKAVTITLPVVEQEGGIIRWVALGVGAIFVAIILVRR